MGSDRSDDQRVVTVYYASTRRGTPTPEPDVASGYPLVVVRGVPVVSNLTAALGGSPVSFGAGSMLQALGEVAARRREVLLQLRDAIERDDKEAALVLAAELVGVHPSAR